jgi:hypothetical protein
MGLDSPAPAAAAVSGLTMHASFLETARLFCSHGVSLADLYLVKGMK